MSCNTGQPYGASYGGVYSDDTERLPKTISGPIGQYVTKGGQQISKQPAMIQALF